jgi:hypothetical protein
MCAEETELQNLNETLLRVTAMLNRLEARKKGDWSPELKERILVLSQKIEKYTMEILTLIEKLEANLKK